MKYTPFPLATSDEIADSDQALIDAAIAAGRVTKCPPMAYTPLEPLGWNVSRAFDRALRRRTIILGMLREGKTVLQISRRMMCSDQNIRDIIKTLRRHGHSW